MSVIMKSTTWMRTRSIERRSPIAFAAAVAAAYDWISFFELRTGTIFRVLLGEATRR